VRNNSGGVRFQSTEKNEEAAGQAHENTTPPTSGPKSSKTRVKASWRQEISEKIRKVKENMMSKNERD